MLRNPAFIVSFSSGSDCGTICASNTDLISGIHLFPSERPFSPFATFATTTLLREEGCDPLLVDEVARANKSTEQKKVKEYAEDNCQLQE